MPKVSEVSKALEGFIGDIWQVPPQYSAVKVSGVANYKNARKGRVVNLGKRQVLIKEIEILEYGWPLLRLRVLTGPGVYIRSLARDLGEVLNVGGYVRELTRTRVGDYGIADCRTPDSLKTINFDTININVQKT